MIIVSRSNDPTCNLQKELLLLDKRAENCLLIYTNKPSVIVGKYQCVEAEVDVDFCKRNNIEIHRRCSGGGSVYHDFGNLNWSFISKRTDKPLLDLQPTLPMVHFLNSFDLPAKVGQRNEITINGYKVSGTASQVTKTGQLVHGTLLFNTDLQMLSAALKGNTEIRGKSIASVPSKVANLSSLTSKIASMEEFIDRMISFFSCYLRI